MDDSTKNQRDFFRIVKVATALALGTMASFLYSMKDLAHDASLEFSAGSVIVFVLGAAVGWFFWTVVANLSQSKRR